MEPVLVRSYTGQRSATITSKAVIRPTLPPVSSYAFADIIRSADGPELQSAIEGIAEICAKNRLSLAEEYASHLPPVGEITEATSRKIGPQLRKPGLRRALTSVPEGSSGSSEGSRRSKRRNIFGFRTQEEIKATVPRKIRIGSMGRSVTVGGTTAIADELETISARMTSTHNHALVGSSSGRCSSAATTSLQRLLGITTRAPD